MQSFSHTCTHTFMVISEVMLDRATPRAWLSTTLRQRVNLLNRALWLCECMLVHVCMSMKHVQGGSCRVEGDLAPLDLFSGCFRMTGDTHGQTDTAGQRVHMHTQPRSRNENRYAPCPWTVSLNILKMRKNCTKWEDFICGWLTFSDCIETHWLCAHVRAWNSKDWWMDWWVDWAAINKNFEVFITQILRVRKWHENKEKNNAEGRSLFLEQGDQRQTCGGWKTTWGRRAGWGGSIRQHRERRRSNGKTKFSEKKGDVESKLKVI